MFKKKNKKGFTIIEALIGISVLTMAVVAPISLASRALYAIQLAKDQMIASQLAQEALEIVRQQRDNELIRLLKNPTDPRNSWLRKFGLSPTSKQRSYTVDVVDISQLYECEDINRECARVYQYEGLYRAEPALLSSEKASAKPSRYKRIVKLYYENENEIKAVVQVRWITGSFPEPKIIQIEDRLFNYLPKRR